MATDYDAPRKNESEQTEDSIEDEFTCSSCFLVHHRSQLARETKGKLICRDCDY